MAYHVVTPVAGCQPIADTSTTRNHPLGMLVIGMDPTYGQGHFRYMLGVASTVVGSLVTYDATTWQTALTTQVPVQARPVAVAMSANVASQYGWYQVSGLAVIKKTAVVLNPQVTIALSATAGRVKGTSTSGLQIGGARVASLTTTQAATSDVIVLIEFPSLQTQIT